MQYHTLYWSIHERHWQENESHEVCNMMSQVNVLLAKTADTKQ